jgi:hypothetical protein
MNAVRNVIGVAIIGIIGLVIVMSIAIGSNVVGWNNSLVSMVQTVIPIVLGAGIIMVMLFVSMGGKGKEGL